MPNDDEFQPLRVNKSGLFKNLKNLVGEDRWGVASTTTPSLVRQRVKHILFTKRAQQN